MNDILTFKTDEHSWLSNMTLVNIECDGIIYPSTENFYQACKYNEVDTKKSMQELIQDYLDEYDAQSNGVDYFNISEHIGAVRALNDLLDDIENMM